MSGLKLPQCCLADSIRGVAFDQKTHEDLAILLGAEHIHANLYMGICRSNNTLAGVHLITDDGTFSGNPANGYDFRIRYDTIESEFTSSTGQL